MSSIDVVLDEVSSLEDASSEGGGPPDARRRAAGSARAPAPPGPLANAALKTPCSSVA